MKYRAAKLSRNQDKTKCALKAELWGAIPAEVKILQESQCSIIP